MRSLTLSILLATPAYAVPTLVPGGLTDVPAGDKTVSVKLGDDPKPLTGQLGIEVGEHGSKIKHYDFTSGALAVKAGRQGGVRSIALNLKESGGLQIGDLVLPPTATLADCADRAPNCVAAGEQDVVCSDGQYWFTASKEGAVTLHLGTASLGTLTGRWKVDRIATAPIHTLPRADLSRGHSATIEKKEVRIGESRCEPKKEELKVMSTARWLEGYKTDPAAMGFSAPIVFEISTGCTDILDEIYAIGDQLVAIRDGNFYVFDRR